MDDMVSRQAAIEEPERPKGDICKKGDKGMHIYNQDKKEVTIELTGSEFHKFIEDARNGGINDAWELLAALAEIKDQLSELEKKLKKHVSLWG